MYIGGCAFNYTPAFESIEDEFYVVGDGILLKYNAPTDAWGDYVETEHTKIVRRNINVGGTLVQGKIIGVGVTVPEGVKKIVSAFYGNEDVAEVLLPSSVTELSDYAFDGASS